MPAPQRKSSRVPYWVRFSVTVVSMVAFTSAFVLVVLPQRFVLQAGLVESGITFPSLLPPYFAPPLPPIISPRVRPPAPPIQPGPGEAFWNGVLPLLRAGQLERTVSLFRSYLARHPDDADVWREFADVLTKLGRYDEAEQIYVRLRASSDDPALTLLLARLLRDRGEPERSLGLYRQLIEMRPDDQDFRHEYAQLLTWSQHYEQAAVEYRWLIERSPSDHLLGLELARVLYWNGQRDDALAELAKLPASGAHALEAAQLRATIESELPVATAPVDTLLEQARQAVVAQEFVEATRLYRALLARDPENATLWLEWADFLQYQRQDLPAAREALLGLATLRDLTHAERFRLAQLYAWTGNEAEARRMLLELVREDSTSAAEWALLGDLYRFGNARLAARGAYASALRLDPDNVQAIEGRAALEQQTADLIDTRERPSAGPEFLYFGDSDAYRRLDVGARASFQLGTTILVARAGYRTLEGVALSGAAASQSGPYLEVEAAQWWRMGTVRTSVSAGFEQLDALGTEPTFAVAIAVPDASGTSLEATFEHGPAFHRTVTLESVLGLVRSDHLEASAYRDLGGGWSLAGSGSVTSLRGGGEANWRFGGFATLRRQISSPFSIALTSQLLSFADAAPVLETRRLYWDPSMFVASGLQLEARARPTGAWNVYGRVTGGAGLVRERTATGLDLVPQFSGEAGITYDTRRLFLTGGLAYLRGREGAYDSFGANLSLGVRY